MTESSNADLDKKRAGLSGGPSGAGSAQSQRSIRHQRSVRNNKAKHRYELVDAADGALRSFADYSLRENAVVIPHVETVAKYRGNGLAEELLDGIVKDLRRTGRTIVPVCPFAAHYLRQRPETHDLLASTS